MEAGNAYSDRVSSDDDAVAQVQAVLIRVGAQLDILRTFVAALTRSDIPTQMLVGLGAHLDQLEAAAAVLSAHPTLVGSVSQNGEAND